ncbi:hypothetical protein GHT09_016128 [Marmota monax]|uniref:Uncharacterized protein n=1 Tax=Marmota monax TaxID=9995 RepID=A0A834Q614_MARMO|nr:hypothetical protein GHT09_016128 [Marmota monax]
MCIHRKSHQECSGKAGGRGRPRQAPRRHKTCPSPREISKVMASMNLGMLGEGSYSEDELLEKCIQSFGECRLPGQPPQSQPCQAPASLSLSVWGYKMGVGDESQSLHEGLEKHLRCFFLGRGWEQDWCRFHLCDIAGPCLTPVAACAVGTTFSTWCWPCTAGCCLLLSLLPGCWLYILCDRDRGRGRKGRNTEAWEEGTGERAGLDTG